MANPDDTSNPTHSTRMLRESVIFEPEMRASLRRTIVAGMFGIMCISVVEGMPLVMLMEALGARNLMIGVLTTIHLLTLAGQIPGAYLAERQAFRKGVRAWFVFTARLLWVFPPLLAWYQPRWRVPVGMPTRLGRNRERFRIPAAIDGCPDPLSLTGDA